MRVRRNRHGGMEIECNVDVSSDIDLVPYMDEIDDSDLISYCKQRDLICLTVDEHSKITEETSEIDYDKLVDLYWHGDFDLNKFLKMI